MVFVVRIKKFAVGTARPRGVWVGAQVTITNMKKPRKQMTQWLKSIKDSEVHVSEVHEKSFIAVHIKHQGSVWTITLSFKHYKPRNQRLINKIIHIYLPFFDQLVQ